MVRAVVPFVHSGMDQVVPRGSVLPRVGKSIRILVGEPIAVADLQEKAAAEQWPDYMLYSAIADRIGQSLHALKAQLEGLPVSEVQLHLHQQLSPAAASSLSCHP